MRQPSGSLSSSKSEKLMNNLRRAFGATTLLIALFAFTSSAFAARREGVMSKEPFEKLRNAKVSERALLQKVPLQGLSLEVELERFEVWARDAKITERGEKGERQLPIPTLMTFKGRVNGYGDSMAYLSVGDDISGLVMIGERKYVIASAPAIRSAAGREIEIFEQDDEDVPLESAGWTCEIDQYGPLTDKGARNIVPNAANFVPSPMATTDSAAMYQLRVALDADFEMTQRLGNTTNVSTYLTNLVGAATAIYERDVRTRLVIGNAVVYATNTDPWTASSSMDALGQLGDHYHNNMSAVSRSATMLLSGKSMGGGIAWVGTVCGGDFQANLNGSLHWGGHYGVIGSLSGSVSTSSSQAGFWDLIGFSHELGHVVGSSHTHCTASSGFGRSFVDHCYSGEGGCYSGATSVPLEKGTIMSYCHTKSGGYSNLRVMFGQPGEASEAISPIIINEINAGTPNGNMTVDGSSSTSLTFAAGSTHSASLPAQSGRSYSWTVSNGTINGSATSNNVNFTTGAFGTPTVLTGTVSNANGCAVVTTRTIALTGSPAPTTQSDAYNATEDTMLNVAAPGVLGNDTNATSATIASQPANGSVSLNANGSFSFTAAANFNGVTSFTYRAVNSSGNSAATTVTLSVATVNDPTTANNDAFGLSEDTSITVTAPGVLSNDTDVDGPASATTLVGPAHGALSLNANGSFTYTPHANFNGNDSFSYRAQQGGGFDDATVTLTVSAVQDPTVAANDAYNATEDVTLNVAVGQGLLANDADADGALTASLVTGPANGTLTLSANGSFSYVPNVDFNGTDSFVYRASGPGSSATATVTINVASAYDFPAANIDAFSTAANTQLVVPSPGVLGNDRVDVGGLSAALVSGPSSGTLSMNANGSFTYTPANAFLGNVTFTYSVNDGLNTDTATVTISVVDLMPSITAISPNSTSVGSGVSISISGINFKSGVTVSFDGTPISSTRNGTTALTATVPAPALAGRLNAIEVCNPDGGCYIASNRFSTNFTDVPQAHNFRPFVNTIFRNGITSGCTPGNYCPTSSVTRAQMAVFLLRAKEGSTYFPPPATGTVFNDVPAGNGFAAWIEELSDRGITSGCGSGNYCPSNPVTRAQMAVFLLITDEGAGYVPPPATGMFPDVPLVSGFAPWIEELARRGITSGCGGGNYCPSNPVTRAQMSAFLVSTFDLQ